MKVLHVIPSVDDRSGGPAQAIFPMCRSLQERGLDLSIVTTNDGLNNDILRNEDGNGIQQRNGDSKHWVQTHKGIKTLFFPVGWGGSFKYSRPLASWLRSNIKNFDAVHIHAVFNHACIAAARECRTQGTPYIVRPLGTLDPWSMKKKVIRKKIFWLLSGQRMLRNASAVHYTARGEQNATEQLFGLSGGTVIPLGVDVIEAASADTISSLPKIATHPYVIVMSRLHPKKGLDVLIDAFLGLTESPRFSNWQLVIAGDGPPEYVDFLKRKVAHRRATESVVFVGWLEGDRKNAALSKASLLALPSYQENFGLCVIEALASETPVLISPQVNLAEDIERAGAGWISQVEVSSLQESLALALGDEEERIRRGRAGKVLSLNFAWNKIAEQLEDLYRSVVSREVGFR